MYAIIIHFMAMYPNYPEVAIVGPVPAGQCAKVMRIEDQVMGLPPGYRSMSHCGDRAEADGIAAGYGCRLISSQPVDVPALPGAIQYVYVCSGPPW